jgi:sec-independent protein translocase protein TatB
LEFEMFDISWSEFLLIAVVALIFIGPKELPAVLRNVGQWTGKIRRMAAEFQSQFQEAMREAEMADLKKHADDLNTAAQSLTKPFDPSDYLGKLHTPAQEPTTATSAPAGTVESATLPAAETVVQSASTPAVSEPAATPAPASEPAGGGGRSA